MVVDRVNPIAKLLADKRPIIMAILNLTPDSFSDGVRGATLNAFLNKADGLIAAGADILDIGGESTRPNADPVTLEAERQRVLPFLAAFRKKHPDFPLSLDTKKYEFAREAMQYGLQILNDVSFLSDVRFIELARQHGCYYVLMHARGDSQSMMRLTEYPDGLVATMKSEINTKIEEIVKQGLSRDKIILDPGFGFAKTPEQCVELMGCLDTWQDYNLPLLFGVSRKRFLQHYTGENAPRDRDEISAKLAQQAVQSGFQIIRAHCMGSHKNYFQNQ